MKRVADGLVGQTAKARNGQQMTITRCRSTKDLDVMFEDGTEVVHKNYYSFKSGSIANPNYFKFIGQSITASNGQQMTVISARSSHDIDVKFEDGTVVLHREYATFKKGNIKNPSFAPKIGEQIRNTRNELMTITGYNSSRDVEVTFEDGTVVQHKSYQRFIQGKVYKSHSSHSHIGETVRARNGQIMTIVAYDTVTDMTVQFEDGSYAYHVPYSQFCNRAVRNKYGVPTIETMQSISYACTQLRHVYTDSANRYYICKCSECGMEDILSGLEIYEHSCCESWRLRSMMMP